MAFAVEQGSLALPPLDFSALERPELEQAAIGLGLPGFRGRQIFQWIHQRGVSDFASMTNLPQDLRAALAARGKARVLEQFEFAARTPKEEAIYRMLLHNRHA